MLVIRRRSGESVFIGDQIQVEVLEIAGNQVKIGITAPKEVLILRNEVRVTADQNRLASRPLPFEKLSTILEKLKGTPQAPVVRGDKSR
jgi:carbon storage regulator